MRATPGALPAVLGRRWARTDRLALLTLARDAFSNEPGSTLRVALGERTHYRRAPWVIDTFEDRATLGDYYQTWTTPAGFGGSFTIVGGQVVPAIGAFSVEQFLTYGIEPSSPSQWAEITVGALASPLTGGYASVGVVLRASPPVGVGNAYLVVARVQSGIATTRLARIAAGTITALAEVATPWHARDRLLGEVDGARLRAYRNGVLIAEAVDAVPILFTGRVGIEAAVIQATDVAAIADFCGGPREEAVGVILDLGDVTSGLGLIDPTGEPARWDLRLSNLQPIGGANRFAGLIRHGVQDLGAYDVIGAAVQVVTAYDGAEPSLSSAKGRVTAIQALQEDSLTLQCAGLDANLEPRIDGKATNYLASAPPFAGPPTLPADPCAASSNPTIQPGTAPPAPPTTPMAPGTGQGPALPLPAIVPAPLGGLWSIQLRYQLARDSLGRLVYVPDTTSSFITAGYAGGTTVIPADDATTMMPVAAQFEVFRPRYTGAVPARLYHFLTAAMYRQRHKVPSQPGLDEGSETFPFYWHRVLFYRGPDVPGSRLVRGTLPQPPSPIPYRPTINTQQAIWGRSETGVPASPAGLTVRLQRFDPAGLTSSAALFSMKPAGPEEPATVFPGLIETIRTWFLSPQQHPEWGPFLGPIAFINLAFLPDADIPLNQFTGPSLIGFDIDPAPVNFQWVQLVDWDVTGGQILGHDILGNPIYEGLVETLSEFG